MTHRPESAERPRYGAIELKDTSHVYMMAGLGLAIAIHLAVVTSYKLAGGTGTIPDLPGPTRLSPLHWVPLPMNPTVGGGLNVAPPGIKNAVGVPVPVEEGIADPGVSLAPNTQFNPSTGSEPGGTPGDIVEPAPATPDETAPLPFTPVEEMPSVVRSAVPAYPDLAIRAGLEGKVIVRLWVDKEGTPRDISVLKSDAEIFNEAAIAAATHYLFTPAIMNGVPVSVWITIPFRFRLAEKR